MQHRGYKQHTQHKDDNDDGRNEVHRATTVAAMTDDDVTLTQFSPPP
jgi:hypothetical protein